MRIDSTGAREVFNNLTIVESRRRIDRVLDNESALVRVPRDEDGLPELPDDFSAPTPGAPLDFSLTPDPDAADSAETLDGEVLEADNYIDIRPEPFPIISGITSAAD